MILAATRGEALGELTREVPKTMLPVGGRPILERSVANLRGWGVDPIRVVVGYAADRVRVEGVETVENDAWAETDEVASLERGLEGVEGPALVVFGDVVFRSYLLGILLRDAADVLVVGDAGARPGDDGRSSDYLVASRPDSEAGLVEGAALVRAFTGPPTPEVHAEWPGLMKLTARGVAETKRWLDEVRDTPEFGTLQLTDLLNALVARDVGVRVHYVRGHWADVDRLVDLDEAGSV